MKKLIPFLILLAGCTTQPKPVFKPVIQLAPKPIALESLPQRSIAKSTVVVPLPPKSITLTWDYEPTLRWQVDHFRLYSCTNLWTWKLKLVTTNQTVTLMPTNKSEYFYVTAFGINGKESEPNTK